MGLHDGNHSLEVCTNALQGAGCASYNWTVGNEALFLEFAL